MIEKAGSWEPSWSANAVDLYPCHSTNCVVCTTNDKRSKNTRLTWKRVRKITWAITNARRTWSDTFTLSYPMEIRRLEDAGDLVTPNKGDDAVAKHANVTFFKRLRRGGAKLKKATAWERHEGERRRQGGTGANAGKLHAHQFIHEPADAPKICHAQIACAKIVWPRGFRKPKRLPDEADTTYWNRVAFGTNPETERGWDREANGKLMGRWRRENLARPRRDQAWKPVINGTIPWKPHHGLACGVQRWRAIVDDTSVAAYLERRRLPAQTGNTHAELVKPGKGGSVAQYAIPAAQYSVSDGGSFSHSPNYGPPEPAPETPGGSVIGPMGEQRPDPQERTLSAGPPASGVAALHSFQERATSSPETPPLPPQTGPPPERDGSSATVAQPWSDRTMLDPNRRLQQIAAEQPITPKAMSNEHLLELGHDGERIPAPHATWRDAGRAYAELLLSGQTRLTWRQWVDNHQ